jgi:hypothetical protein
MRLIREFDTRLEAEIYAQALDEANIPFVIQAGDGGGNFPVLLSSERVQLYVSDEDYENHLELFQDLEP